MLKLKLCIILFLCIWHVQGLFAQEIISNENILPVKAKGDVNGDRMVDAKDLVYVINATMGHPLNGYDEEAADINGDGDVNEKDIAEISNIILGMASDESLEWSSRSSIYIPTQPRCALVNISGITSMPIQKETDAHAWMEVWDMNGIYFKKKVIIDLQGNTSVNHAKKNFAVDFCEDEWIGDETTDIKIGDWVTQDGFHFKSFYTSITKGECPVGYKLYQKFLETKEPTHRAPFMDYYTEEEIINAINGDDEKKKEAFSARCFPDGFPCIVYLNDQFYGIFSWQLKKHRDNYNMDRNKVNNIHLDGALGDAEIWHGNIKWGSFEVRNPKPKKSKWTLMCQDGTKYDGDNPKELMGTDSQFYDENDANCKNSAQTKEHVIALSKYMSEINEFETNYKNAASDEKSSTLSTLKKEIEKRFSMEWMVDYIILNIFLQNSDCIRKNWQWTTWGEIDGKERWYPNPYDLDHAFGVQAVLAFNLSNPNKLTPGKDTNTPARYVWDYYFDDMKSRYAELRKAGVISYDTVWGLMKDWVDRVGVDNYAKEAEKWPEMPCNRESYISNNWKYAGTYYRSLSDGPSNWSITKSFSSGAYTKYNYRCYQSLQDNNKGHIPNEENSTWWKDVTIKPGTYKAGEEVFDGRCNFYKFRAQTDIVVSEDNSNNDRQDHLIGAPFEKLYSQYPYEGGVHDSVDRIEQWIQDKIKVMDEQMNYDEN